jgi:O-antigen ligase
MKVGGTDSLDLLRRPKEMEFSTYGVGIGQWDRPARAGGKGAVVGGAMSSAGFVLTAIFVFVTIISPEQFGKEWATYHALTYLGTSIVLISLPAVLIDLRMRSSTQIFLLLGFIVAMGISEAANGWFGGALVTWELFLPSAIVFFFIVANVNSTRRLRILITVLIASCLVVVVEALCGYYFGFRGRTFLVYQHMISDRGEWADFGRVRGAGFLSDPNDFAQLLLIALPLTTIQWTKGRRAANFFMVIVPAGLLMWAIFLTHSRGALVALALMALFSVRQKLGNVLSVVVTTVGIMGMFALNFTGGRLISADAGSDRLWLWASGLEMFKRSPLFGVGFGKFADFAELTAHNSFILCLAELGLIGCTLWLAMLVTTMLDLSRMIRVLQDGETKRSFPGVLTAENETFLPGNAPVSIDGRSARSFESMAAPNVSATPEYGSELTARWVVGMRLSLISFLATSWFLSRAYQSTMYVMLGLAAATIMLDARCADHGGRKRWLFVTVAIEGSLIVFIYLVVRLRF